MEKILVAPEVIAHSGGVINWNMDQEHKQSSTRQIERVPRTLSELCQIVLLFLPDGIPSSTQEHNINKRLNLPLLNPPVVRNADKFLIITESSFLPSLYKLDLIQKLKYKLFLTISQKDSSKALKIIQFCIHCPQAQQEIHIEKIPQKLTPKWIPQLFPDFQLNYFGFTLKVSSTDKMEGDLEFAQDPITNQPFAKRGVFASALNHLVSGLNFTAALFRSTAGASTGHKLRNGTWVGSVGDVYSGAASFCMLCGMSYSRHSIVEICSPVTYEYIRFSIGPSDKLYTWEAIFWPFDIHLWIGIGVTTIVAVIVCQLIFKIKEEDNHSHWNILSVSQYFGRIFLEQSDRLPVGLPQSIRIILGFWLLFALIGTTVYRAKMVNLLTFPVFEHIPLTYHELAESHYDIEFHYFPNIAYNAFKSSTNPTIVKIFQKMSKQTDPIKCLKNTMNSKSVCILFSSVNDDLINRNVSDNFGQTPIKQSTNYAFMFTPGISSQKRADFSPNFHHILSTSIQMGLNEWWERSDAYQLLKNKNSWLKTLGRGGNHAGVFQYENEDLGGDLHLKNLKGAFAVFVGGLVSAMAAFLLENGLSVWSKNVRKLMTSKNLWNSRVDRSVSVAQSGPIIDDCWELGSS
ncbi:unnamed protein product [Orchesella dallaii]|uniref:Ionotropic glutamate receptor C-terminal domain-containing protein n=1 Tax=Orchesella dallaii TaxID=48710 RepID=A0ABP1RZ59_9HEXA